MPVAADDWYQRRRNDAEGAFFRAVANQGPRKGAGGGTRQGIYVFTASGKLLAYRNAQDAEVMLETLRLGLRRWNALPAGERKPGAVKVPALDKVDVRFTRTLPKGGLVLNVSTRILERQKKGLVKGSCDSPGGDRAARDHVWLTRADWEGLVPAAPKKGQSFPMPPAIAQRLLRYHFLDNTRGEPPYWGPEQVRKSSLTWTVESVTPAEVRMKLVGSALLATAPKDAERGFDLSLLGYLTYDRARKVITRFDAVAIGDHWGDSDLTRGARPGRKPLGIVLELSPGTNPADLVPPQAAREAGEYLPQGS